MSRLLHGLLWLTALVAGYPYAALPIGYMTGTNAFVMADAGGVPRTVVIGRDAPRPDWLPHMPRAIHLKATHWVALPGEPHAGGAELISHASAAEIAAFYMAALAQSGFEMRDDGTGPLDPATAAYLGIERGLTGTHPGLGISVRVAIRSPSGLLLRPRLVQIDWGSWSDRRSGDGGEGMERPHAPARI